MVWVASALPAGLLSAEQAGIPMFLPHNALRSTSVAVWHDGDAVTSWPQTDVTAAGFPVSNIWDGHNTTHSRADTGADSIYYLYFEWATGVTIDTIYIRMDSVAEPVNADIEIADDFNPATRRVTIYSHTGMTSGTTVIALDIDSDLYGAGLPNRRFPTTELRWVNIMK